jgi:hypothetical protein
MTAATLRSLLPQSRLSFAGAPSSATVVWREGRSALLERCGEAVAARVAFGCVVQPEPGDLVLACEADGETWVAAVLDRPSDAPMRLWAEGDVSLVSARGDVSLAAAGAVALDAGERVRAAAPQIELHAAIGRLVIDELTQVGRRASLYVGRLRTVAETVETFAGHALARVRRSSRFVEESDQLRAGDVDHRAAGNMQLRARTAFVTAETVVRIDAEQIHMG